MLKNTDKTQKKKAKVDLRKLKQIDISEKKEGIKEVEVGKEDSLEEEIQDENVVAEDNFTEFLMGEESVKIIENPGIQDISTEETLEESLGGVFVNKKDDENKMNENGPLNYFNMGNNYSAVGGGAYSTAQYQSRAGKSRDITKSGRTDIASRDDFGKIGTGVALVQNREMQGVDYTNTNSNEDYQNVEALEEEKDERNVLPWQKRKTW